MNAHHLIAAEKLKVICDFLEQLNEGSLCSANQEGTYNNCYEKQNWFLKIMHALWFSDTQEQCACIQSLQEGFQCPGIYYWDNLAQLELT